MLEPVPVDVPISSNVSTAVVPLMAHNPRARKLRSAVWQDFTKERRADGNCVAVCNHCKKQLTATSRSGTTHLRNHLAICTSTSTPTRRTGSKRRKLIVRRLLNSKSSAGVRASDGPISADEHDNDNGHFDQEVSRQDLALMIVQHGYRFSIVNDAGFQKFIKNLQPHFKMVSYETVRDDSMKIYDEERIKLHDTLSRSLCRVSLSVDMWRSSTHMDYICLTCHYIDHVGDEWKLRKRILNFVHLEAPFTAEQIAKLIVEKLHYWGIDKKLTSVVVDNCSSGDIIAREIRRFLQPSGVLLLNGELFRVRSSAHILNLMVQESLEQVCDMTNRVRATIHHVKSSQETSMMFQNAEKRPETRQRPLLLDSPNNWASTYSMFESACHYKDVFTRLAEWDAEYVGLLSAKDWADVTALTEILDVLNRTMEKFLTMETPTANLSFNEICSIHLLLKTWCSSPSPVVAQVASQMLLKLEEYWVQTRTVMALASILDPRYKMKSVEYFFKIMYNDQFEAKARIDGIHKTFINLYNEYAVKSADSSNNPALLCYAGNSSSCMSSEYGNGEDSKTFSRITLSDARRGLDQYLQETSSGQSLKTDLDMYLEEAVHRHKDGLPDNFDILGWWKSFAAKYPVLSLMSRDILAIPISIVPLDSEARTLNEYLSTMDPLTVQGLICAQDWLRDEAEVSGSDGGGADEKTLQELSTPPK